MDEFKSISGIYSRSQFNIKRGELNVKLAEGLYNRLEALS